MSGPWVVGEVGAWLAAMALMGFGACVSGLYGRLRGSLLTLEPAVRERALAALVGTPWTLAVLLVGSCFLPSLRDWVGLAADHCGIHGSHHLHLCFHHAGSVERSAVAGALGGLSLVVLAAGLLVGVRSWWRYVRLTGGLQALSSEAAEPGMFRVATRNLLAITLGIVRPRIFLSEGLEEALDPEDQGAVVAHERAHVQRRDGLRKLLMAVFSVPLLPPVRDLLLADHAETCEERCDGMAAEAVGEAAVVARALLRVVRLGRASPDLLPGPVCHFGPSHASRRIRVLLDPPWEANGKLWIRGFGGGLTLAVTCSLLAAGPLHHAAETALAILF